ncbi:MAG: cupin domain-containing protein [Ignavibacteriaceae bacterium]|nr:cupin domain-containing protein [Ignavibacteriaceae bacterium]
MKALTILFIFTAVLFAGAKNAFAQDAAEVAPEKVKVLFENDKVRVLEFTLKPGEETGMHSHSSHVVYFLTDGKMLTTTPDGESSEMEVKNGDTRWIDPVTHNNKNIGKSAARTIVLELK